MKQEREDGFWQKKQKQKIYKNNPPFHELKERVLLWNFFEREKGEGAGTLFKS